MKVLDTYAILEIFSQNKKFEHLLNEEVFIADLTMSEAWGTLYKKFNKRTADFWLNKFVSICAQVNLNTLIKAREFKILNAKKDLSFIDCVGYTYAKEKGYVFVTGDKEFQNLPNVEYIKS